MHPNGHNVYTLLHNECDIQMKDGTKQSGMRGKEGKKQNKKN